MYNYHYYIAIIYLMIPVVCKSQAEKIAVRNGNEAYFSGKTVEATNYYSKSLKEKPDYYKENFNLGDALYKTGELIKAGKIAPPNKKMKPDSAANLVFDQAAQQFEVVAKSISNADTIQRAWHNYGNSKLKQRSFEDAILGYKKALKLNPKDEDTRYNLAYAQRELKKQKDKEKKNDKKDDQKKDGDKPEDKKEKQNNKQDAQNQPQMSKEQAEQMLNALMNSEKKMQSLRKKKGDPSEKIKVEKDW